MFFEDSALKTAILMPVAVVRSFYLLYMSPLHGCINIYLLQWSDCHCLPVEAPPSYPLCPFSISPQMGIDI